MDNFEYQLEKFADLAVTTGVNIQEGQALYIGAPLESAPLVRQIVKKAYMRGAKYVHVDWHDDESYRLRFEYAPDSSFEEVPTYLCNFINGMAEEDSAFLNIVSPNPELLKDIEPSKIALNAKMQSIALTNYMQRIMSHQNRWSIIAVPSESWASKVFPNIPLEDAIEKLWDVIFRITRVDRDDPIQAWKDHNHSLLKTRAYLNKKQYTTLIYRAPGTDLTIDLPIGHIWLGGDSASPDGIHFNPNMPTEEVFTMPHKDGVNGTVRSTMPLHYSGNIIDNFTLTFKDGKVIDFTAEKGYDILKNLIESDEGSCRLGEVALVPHDSPISNSNLIFYNTLFDENASCHLALGRAYPTTLEGGANLSQEELMKRGVNNSYVHVDFMIGSKEMEIDAITNDGIVEPVFRNGNWAVTASVL